MSPSGRSKLALLLIALAALGIQRSATLPWGMVDTADGRRIAVSPIGASQISPTPHPATASDCRWWPIAGDADLCAVATDGSAAFAGLRRVYPMMSAALWLSIGALFLQVLRVPQSAVLRSSVTAAVGAIVAFALVNFFTNAGRALAVLGGRDPRLETPWGVMALLALVLAAVSAWLHWDAHRANRPRP